MAHQQRLEVVVERVADQDAVPYDGRHLLLHHVERRRCIDRCARVSGQRERERERERSPRRRHLRTSNKIRGFDARYCRAIVDHTFARRHVRAIHDRSERVDDRHESERRLLTARSNAHHLAVHRQMLGEPAHTNAQRHRATVSDALLSTRATWALHVRRVGVGLRWLQHWSGRGYRGDRSRRRVG